MATARDQKCQEEGLGTVGKFTVERFLRKSPAKPYDRPPKTALTTSGRSGNSSWILKLVDLAQRLISSGSQMLFSSVFRYLPHRSTTRSSSQVLSESSKSRKDGKKANGTDPFEVQEATNVGDNRNSSDRFVMMELEKTLKQTTLTRSEFDHLTTLLHSRNVDLPVVNEEKSFELISSIPESNRKEFVKLPNSESRMGRQSISTPILSSSVLDEDISSPAEIARAYMRSRKPEVCPSIRSLQAQGLVENSASPTDMLLVPSSTGQGLKRRSSFFYSDIGSIVPPRRIREKRNISKGLSLPGSARPISIPVDGFSFDQNLKFGKVQHFPSSIRNSQLSLKPKKTIARKFIMNVESDNIPGTGSSSIYTPSRSYKMASKILEQLDKLTPPKEKVSTFNRFPVGKRSPLKPSPSIVGGGPPLRSLMDVGLPRNKEFVDDDKQSNGLHGIPYHDNLDHTFQNKEKMENMKSLDLHHRCDLLKDSGSIVSNKDSTNDLGVPPTSVVKSVIQPQKSKQAFQMWPDKDNVDHDENSADGVAPATAEVKEGDISLAVRQTTATEALAPGKPQTTSEVVVGSPLNKSTDLKTPDDSIDDDMDTRFAFQNASSLCTTSQQETIDSVPTNSFENKDLPDNKQSDSPVISFGNNVTPHNQPIASSTAFDVGNKVASLTELRPSSENGNGAPYTQCHPASRYSDDQRSVYLNTDTSSNYKLDCSRGTCNGEFSSSASTSAGLAFPLSSSTCNQSLNNGTSISCPSLFSSYSSAIASMRLSSSRNIFLSAISASNHANVTATDNRPSTTLAPSSDPSTTGLGTYEDKIKLDAILQNVNDTYFNSIPTPANSHNSMLGLSAAATLSPVNNQLNPPTVISATELSAQEVSAGMEFTPNAERTSMILGSSMLDASPGMAGKASVSSGISFGCSPSASELFNSGSRPSEFPIVGFTSSCTSNATTSCAPFGFESFTGAHAHFSSICPTTSAAAALAGSSSKSISSNSHPEVAFRVSPGNNNDCEEQQQQQGISKAKVPLFSQKQLPSPLSEFSFGPATSELNSFQVGKQQTLAEPQDAYPCITSSTSLEAAKAGSRFSLRAGRVDKPKRRFLKIKRKR